MTQPHHQTVCDPVSACLSSHLYQKMGSQGCSGYLGNTHVAVGSLEPVLRHDSQGRKTMVESGVKWKNSEA